MAAQTPPIQFDNIPLDEARRMGRGPRMDPQLYRALTEKLEGLGNHGTRMTLPEEVRFATMKNRILRIATQLKTTVTVRP